MLTPSANKSTGVREVFRSRIRDGAVVLKVARAENGKPCEEREERAFPDFVKGWGGGFRLSARVLAGGFAATQHRCTLSRPFRRSGGLSVAALPRSPGYDW